MCIAKMTVAALAIAVTFFPAGAFAQAPAANTSEAIGDWTLQCRTAPSKQTFCVLGQDVVSKTEKNQFLSISIRQIGKDGQLAMFILTPLGIFLGAGIAGKVDQGEQFLFKLHSCTAHGCGAAVPISPGIRAAMIKGTRLIVAYKPTPGSKPTQMPVSLRGMAKGLLRVGLK